MYRQVVNENVASVLLLLPTGLKSALEQQLRSKSLIEPNPDASCTSLEYSVTESRCRQPNKHCTAALAQMEKILPKREMITPHIVCCTRTRQRGRQGAHADSCNQPALYGSVRRLTNVNVIT